MRIFKWLKNLCTKRPSIYYIYNRDLSLYLMQNFSGMTNNKYEAGLFNEVVAFDFVHSCHSENVYQFIIIEKRV